MSRLIDLYPYSLEKDDLRLLILQRAEDVIYARQWRMVGGKVKKGERAKQAACRELKEETGLEPLLFWTVPTINQFYDPDTDEIKSVPAFAARVDPGQPIVLDQEHTGYKWISVGEVEEYIKWPEQVRIMNILSTIVTENQILEEWII